MWSFFINNSKFAYLFLIALIVLGGYSIASIPRESAPEVIIPVGIVTTVLPGAPATDIETLVTNELERGLVNVENVNEITSVSREGVSTVVVEFDASADIDESLTDLKDAVDDIKPDLPEDAEDPIVSEVNFTDQPVMTIALAAEISDFAFTELVDQVEDSIESVAGVSRVESSGVREKEIAIIIEQSSLLRYDLSLNDVINSVRNANIAFPVGQIENDGVSYNVAFEGDITESNQIPNISVATRNGQPVYVRDIATVEDGLAPARTISRLSLNNEPSKSAVTLDVYKQSGGDITAITKSVNEELQTMQEVNGLLYGIDVLTVLDAGKDINTDLIRLSSSGLQTVALVVLLLVIAIGWREGLLAGTAIPLSFLFGFIGLYLSGNTINFLSLFSLILGIGILVDSAIVMVEGINRKMKDDPTIDKKYAALATINEFKAPLISGTLTTVSMFVGLFIVSGVIGQFIASIPFTLVFLLFASMFVALAIIPLLAASFLKRRSQTKMEQLQVEYAHRLETWYQNKLTPYIEDKNKADNFLAILFSALIFSIFLAINLLAGLIAAFCLYFLTLKLRKIQTKRDWGALKYRITWLLSFVFSIALAVVLMITVLPSWQPVKVVFFEQSDIEYLIVEIEEPEGTTKEVTDIVARRVEEIIYTEPDIESFVVTVGSGSQFNESSGTGEKLANFFITLSEDRDRISSEVVESLRERLEPLRDSKVTVGQLSDGPPTGAAIIVKFLGDDLQQLTDLANNSALILKEQTGVVNVETSTNSNNTEYVLSLDRDKAASLGLNVLTVSQIARTAVFGTDVTSITTINDDIDVVVKLNTGNQAAASSDTANQATIDDLSRISIPTPTGDVPLSSLVTISLRESSSVINHEDQKRVITLTADVSPGTNAREAQAAALATIREELSIPASVTLSTGGGETEESNEAFAEMFLALIVGILLMIGVLVLQFNSYLHTRYVLSILPFSLIGIFIGLGITGSSLSFPSMMGFIALSGIVVNNSILLIDMMNNMRRANPEKSIKAVVVDSATSRLRPILLTTTTTVIGMTPLLSAGDLWIPLALAVMFGLLFSVIITLVLIPIIYYRNPGSLN
jgi:multidrug efflux pump subunit AcrB